jgi:hypothetical protein
MWGALKSLFSGEDAESREARLRMEQDAKADPRRAFVWGVLAVSYRRDPAYLKAHATEAIRNWYGVKSREELLAYTPNRFGTKSHAGYNHYRLCFLARAGHGAGVLTEDESWSWAFREAAAVQRAYADWRGYAHGYFEGHLEYRKSQGDSPERLNEIRTNILTGFAEKDATWSSIPYGTPLP